MAQWRFDAVVLYAGGFEAALAEMLASLRRDRGVPILLVDAGADEAAQLRALEAGASQLVVEPTSTRVLAAQLRRLIDVARPRLPQEDPSEVRFGPLRLDYALPAASVGNGPADADARRRVEVPPARRSRPGDPVHQAGHRPHAYTAPTASETWRSADMHVCRIRKKLRDAGAASLQTRPSMAAATCCALCPRRVSEMAHGSRNGRSSSGPSLPRGESMCLHPSLYFRQWISSIS